MRKEFRPLLFLNLFGLSENFFLVEARKEHLRIRIYLRSGRIESERAECIEIAQLCSELRRNLI